MIHFLKQLKLKRKMELLIKKERAGHLDIWNLSKFKEHLLKTNPNFLETWTFSTIQHRRQESKRKTES